MSGWCAFCSVGLDDRYFLLWFGEDGKKVICEECAGSLRISQVTVIKEQSEAKMLFVGVPDHKPGQFKCADIVTQKLY